MHHFNSESALLPLFPCRQSLIFCIHQCQFKVLKSHVKLITRHTEEIQFVLTAVGLSLLLSSCTPSMWSSPAAVTRLRPLSRADIPTSSAFMPLCAVTMETRWSVSVFHVSISDVIYHKDIVFMVCSAQKRHPGVAFLLFTKTYIVYVRKLLVLEHQRVNVSGVVWRRKITVTVFKWI